MNSSFGAKLAVFLFSVFLLSYVGYQAYVSLYDPYETEIVTSGQYVQSVNLDGFFVRNEIVLDGEKTGVVDYHYRNAQKISKNAVIADVYANESDLYHLKQIKLLETQKTILEQAQNKENIESVKLDLLNKQISGYKMDLVQCVDSEDFNSLEDAYRNLMLSMDRFNVFVDSKLSYQSTIDSLTAQINSLKSQVSSLQESISSEKTGYFANVVDGYETVFTPAMLDTLTISQTEDFLKKKNARPGTKIGKVEPDTKWYFVSLITAKEAECFETAFETGRPITLQFSSQSSREVPVVIENLITDPGQKNAVAVFSCCLLDQDFVTMRFEKPKAIIADYNGIIIPKEAIRVKKIKGEDGTEVNAKGVFVQLGSVVRFKRVEPVYEDNYVLISQTGMGDSYVAIYDQVITKGKDLHETAD